MTLFYTVPTTILGGSAQFYCQNGFTAYSCTLAPLNPSEDYYTAQAPESPTIAATSSSPAGALWSHSTSARDMARAKQKNQRYGLAGLIAAIRQETPILAARFSDDEFAEVIRVQGSFFRTQYLFGISKLQRDIRERRVQVFKRIWLQNIPDSVTNVASDYNGRRHSIYSDIPKTLKLFIDYLVASYANEFWSSAPDQFRKISMAELGFYDWSVRTFYALKRANIETIGDLVRCSESDLLRQKKFGTRSLREVKDFLNGRVLTLGMTPPDEAVR